MNYESIIESSKEKLYIRALTRRGSIYNMIGKKKKQSRILKRGLFYQKR